MSNNTDRRKRKPATLKPARKAKQRKCPALAHIRKHRLASDVARKIGLERAAVSMWKRVPAKHVIKVGALLRIAKNRIRPDIYPASGPS
jgi:hypothetical protein